MISVVFFQDKGLKRSQQMFSDLNKNAVKPTKSLSILYDHRDKFSKFIVGMINIVEIFQGRVELEKTTMSNRSTKVFTLNGISDATMHLLGMPKGKKHSEEEESISVLFPRHLIKKRICTLHYKFIKRIRYRRQDNFTKAS